MVLTLTRAQPRAEQGDIRAVVGLAAVTILLQTAHFAEELVTGFHRRFPEILGVAPWSSRFFVSFNLFWLGAWIVSIWGVTARRQSALFALWFLAIACVANGLAHPLLSARVGGYFPGLFTSPLIGIAGMLLLRRLLFATRPH
jgi:hypothetical protein